MMLTGSNGVLTRAGEAKIANDVAQTEERIKLAYHSALMADLTNENRELTKETLQVELNKEFTGKTVTITDSTDEKEWIISVDGVEVSVKAGKSTSGGSGGEVPKGPNGKPLINQITVASITNEKIVGEDKFGNQVVIPEGFKLAQGANGSGDCVKDGIVIEDNEGNQYVWIPVSNINHDGNNKIKVDSASEEGVEITLGRYKYTFDLNSPGNQTQYANTYNNPITIESIHRELIEFGNSNETNTNTTARGIQENGVYNGIKGFIESVRDNKGYYIARYEASYREINEIPKAGSIPSTSSSATLSLTSAPSTRTEGELWNFVKQGDAATACYDLYTTVKSDLMNSYAWDTAIVYIQAMGNTNYANAYDGNGTLKNTGYTGCEKCKIFDMDGNEWEWTTEYSTWTLYEDAYPCTYRGGCYASSDYYTGRRIVSGATIASKNISFRSVLFL